jgi:TrpR-related protein YerC/YecD
MLWERFKNRNKNMAKVRVYSIDKKEKQKIVGELLEIIAILRSREEVFGFMIGLLTPNEILMVARRIQIAKMLLNDDGYDVIRKKLKVSFQTINKVEHWLKSDDNKLAIISDKIKKIEEKNKRKTGREYSKNLLDKYAKHRFIKNLLQ